jgi:WS/DGAT/MGAT family acyltransferase
MHKLSAIDQAFFMLETAERPMNIGALFVLLPPRGRRGNLADEIVKAMLTRRPGPPFNGRLRPGAIKGLVELVEDEQMDPAPQVHHHRLRAGTSLERLFEIICEVHVERLSRDRPLWEQHVFTGLSGGRLALYFKTHHGLIDGIGFLKALNALVSTSPSERGPRAIWEGLRGLTSAATSTGTSAATGMEALLGLATTGLRTANDLMRLGMRLGLRGLGLGPGLVAPFVSTPDVLKAAPSANRVIAHCSLPLGRVRAAARAGGAKVNDVMLCVIDAAMVRYLQERGAAPDRALVADMPVALEDHGGAGNRITILQVPMGRPGGSPAQRLRDILWETMQVKAEVRSLSGNALTFYSIAEHTLANAIESFGLRNLPMLANAVISNPAGLEQRVYFNGAEVELALPVSVVPHHQVLNITVTTYVDELHLTFMAVREAVPDVRKLADYTVAALSELEDDLAKERPGKTRETHSTERRQGDGEEVRGPHSSNRRRGDGEASTEIASTETKAKPRRARAPEAMQRKASSAARRRARPSPARSAPQ